MREESTNTRSQRGARAWARAGLDAFEVGDEAVLDATAFTLEGRPMRGVRQAVHRVRRAGYAVRVLRMQRRAPAEGGPLRAAFDAADAVLDPRTADRPLDADLTSAEGVLSGYAAFGLD